MATHQVLFSETVAGMKKALKRRAYESDSDDEVDPIGNRGQKLKKRARFSQRGQLMPPSGPESYKETIEYAGVRRDIINRNPPLVDDDGYEVESDDDDHERLQEATANAIDQNPYSNIRLEDILAPLTAITDLPNHETLSRPFTSKSLTDIAEQSCEIVRQENQTLWQVRHLLTVLCGDYTWAPCKLMLGPNDLSLFAEDHLAAHLSSKRSLSAGLAGAPGLLVNGESKLIESSKPTSAKNDSSSAEETSTAHSKGVLAKTDAGAESKSAEGPASTAKANQQPQEKSTLSDHAPNGHPSTNTSSDDHTSSSEKALKSSTNEKDKKTPEKSMQNGTSPHPGDGNHGAETNGVSSTSLVAPTEATVNGLHSSDGGLLSTDGDRNKSEFFVHPLFAPPPFARPDRDIGLPENEADKIRHFMMLYVQKQEEICRGVNKLAHGLLKADRLRKTVLQWSKAEAHCGPNRDMSDGEDWYDKEEWNLTEDLKKGEDEEEEDTTTTSKKTRNRR